MVEGSTNAAFVFIKPHANNENVQKLVKETLNAKGVEIKKEGDYTGQEIDKGQFIDQHYYAIASKATLKQPAELNVPVEKFSAKFGEEWSKVLEEGRAYNAKGYAAHRNWTPDELDKENFKTKKAGLIEKFGGGFYCAQFDNEGVKEYVFNGFFMAMRNKFTNDAATIHWYSVEWDPATLSWEDFRGKVLGPTDPAEAPEGSLRRTLFDSWKDLGLSAEPNTGDNGVHASASPFEGLAERLNWLKATLAEDVFGAKLLDAGLTEAMINDWSVDPQVTYEDDSKGSIFDALEDMNAADCLAKCKALAAKQ